MIQIQRIRTTDTSRYSYMEDLLVESFPPEEYRPLTELRECTDRKENFYNNILISKGQPIGLLTYWNFNTFCYVEHFAIDPILRGGGYGKEVVETLFRILNSPVILEVEPPAEEIAKRRINFYQRQGFVLWEKEYMQPPYRRGESPLPMLLMASSRLSCEKNFEEVKSKIYAEVYGCI